MLTRQELKRDAWQKLSERWGTAAGISAVYIGITAFIGMALFVLYRNLSRTISANNTGLLICYTVIIPIIIMPITAVIETGYTWICLKWSRNENAHLKAMFQPFWQIRKVFAVSLLVYLIQLPFAILQKLPGFWKANAAASKMIQILGPVLMVAAAIVTIYIGITFILTPYILYDQQELGIIATMKRSAAIMKGHKWDCFELRFSFALWCVAGMLLCGIGLLWVLPYLNTTMANFYNDLLLQEQQRAEVAVPEEITE